MMTEEIKDVNAKIDEAEAAVKKYITDNNLTVKQDASGFYYNIDAWKGCFGGMTIIRHNYLKYIHYMSFL